MTNESIWIVTRDDAEEETIEGAKGFGRDVNEKLSALKPKLFDSAQLKQEWNQTMRVIGDLIQDTEKEAGDSFGMQLDEVTLAVEINAKGQITLLGACSGEANGKGAITLKFKRVEPK